MAKRIGFVHTAGFLVENFREKMKVIYPEADCFHILNENLLQDLLRGAPKELVYRRVVAQVVMVAEAGADFLFLHLPGCRYRAASGAAACSENRRSHGG